MLYVKQHNAQQNPNFLSLVSDVQENNHTNSSINSNTNEKKIFT